VLTVEPTARNRRIQAWRLRLGWWLDSGLTLVVLNFLHHWDLAAHGTIWALNGVLVAVGVVQHPRVQRWMAGARESTWGLWGTTALPVSLTAAAMYLTGWGPLLGVGFVALVSAVLAVAGSRAMRPVSLLVIAAACCGQGGIALGWIYTYLPPTTAQVIGVLGTIATLATARALGLAVAEREREAVERGWAEKALRASEESARRNEERFRTLVQDSSDMVAVSNPAGNLTYVSPAVQHVMGYTPEEYLQLAGIDLIHPEDRPVSVTMAESLISGAIDHRAEIRLRHADDTWHWHEVYARNLIDNPSVGGLAYNHRDITERKQYQERLAHDASHDALTGLMNRTALMHALTAVCSSANPGFAAVLFLDLDGFKRINDELGHEAGDQVLRATARALRDSVLGADTVARLGGDEFAVVLSTVHSADSAVAVATRILERLNLPVTIGGHPVQTRASIGVTAWRPGAVAADEALRRADLAMYRAKREKTHGWKLYVEGMQDHRSDAGALEDDLRRALDNDELEVFYQPVVDLETERIVGMEALARWQHPSRGWLPPVTFIPLAEETGLIGALGAMVLRQATVQLVQWQRRWPQGPHLTLSVNLSPRQLERQTLVAEIRGILENTGVDPRDVVLELTESAAVDDPAVAPKLRALGDLGLRIALDDFGTGYSSLRYLTELPVDLLKIDRRFVDKLDGSPKGAAVTEAVIMLAGVLQLDVIAEGVETVEQASELLLRGCRKAQGFLFAKPVDAEAMVALLDQDRAGAQPALARQTALAIPAH
jgi:diguanylate cyclase (GGDEF)-like protein/PAS domain S-box-containing protein